MQATASSLANLQQRMVALMREDENNDTPPGQGSFADFVAPLQITPQIVRQIKELPLREESSIGSPIWLVHIHTDRGYEGTSSMCTVFQVTKEFGSNGAILCESDGLGVSLASSGVMDPTNDMSIRPWVLIGTIAKACLEPGIMGVTSIMPSHYSQSRPKKVLFQTRGEMAMVEPDLHKMGIYECDVAERALIRSIELHNSAMNDAQVGSSIPLTPAGLGNTIMAQSTAIQDPYVEETPVSLGAWSPPDEVGDLPARWYARPPDDQDSYRPTALLGWRTNLERALLREDTQKVNDIVKRYSAKDIREFVECRMLLTKCAQRGLIDSCELLIEGCGASVEGAQASDAESWWISVQNTSGNCDSLTPLHRACRDGQQEAVKFLLDKGADMNKTDKSRMRGCALTHAVSGGDIDCCRILCERGADPLFADAHGNNALDVSECVAVGDIYRTRVQRKVQEILREYDPRCSYCQRPNPTKRCPCAKERYCNAQCQKGRWKEHKKYHKICMQALEKGSAA